MAGLDIELLMKVTVFCGIELRSHWRVFSALFSQYLDVTTKAISHPHLPHCQELCLPAQYVQKTDHLHIGDFRRCQELSQNRKCHAMLLSCFSGCSGSSDWMKAFLLTVEREREPLLFALLGVSSPVILSMRDKKRRRTRDSTNWHVVLSEIEDCRIELAREAHAALAPILGVLSCYPTG